MPWIIFPRSNVGLRQEPAAQPFPKTRRSNMETLHNRLLLPKLEFLGKDIHGLDIGLRDKQRVGVGEESLRYLPIDMVSPAIRVFEGVEDPKGSRRDLECKPCCGPRFRLHQWASGQQKLFYICLFARTGLQRG